jgi:hypothetical protein
MQAEWPGLGTAVASTTAAGTAAGTTAAPLHASTYQWQTMPVATTNKPAPAAPHSSTHSGTGTVPSPPKTVTTATTAKPSTSAGTSVPLHNTTPQRQPQPAASSKLVPAAPHSRSNNTTTRSTVSTSKAQYGGRDRSSHTAATTARSNSSASGASPVARQFPPATASTTAGTAAATGGMCWVAKARGAAN